MKRFIGLLMVIVLTGTGFCATFSENYDEGYAKRLSGKYAEALEDFENAKAIAPTNDKKASTLIQIAECYQGLGNPNEVLSAADFVLGMDDISQLNIVSANRAKAV